MSQENKKITKKEFDQYVRGFGEKMPEKLKNNVLEEIRRKEFEKSMEKEDSKEKDEPDLEL